MPDNAIPAATTPIEVKLEPGTYWWCACGRSKSQPFCDGSHKGTGIAPQKYDCTAAQSIWACRCKLTCKAPHCDGSHKKLPKAPPAP